MPSPCISQLTRLPAWPMHEAFTHSQVAASIQRICQSTFPKHILIILSPQTAMLWQQQRLQHSTAQERQPDSVADNGQKADPPLANAGGSSSSTSISFEFTSQVKKTQSGYVQSFAVSSQDIPDSAQTAASSGDLQQQQQRQRLFQEVLRIPLRQEEKQESSEGQLDVYSLSRSLVGSMQQQQQPTMQQAATAADAEQCQPQQRLTAADKDVLEKLVGIMTKDGKKSRARRILLEAMHIINQQVNKKDAA